MLCGFARWGRRITALSLLFISVVGCSGDSEKGKVKYLESGQRYMRKGKYQEATIQFQNALQLDPRFVEAFYQLAQAQLAQHQWRQAYDALERAIALNPERLDARLDRGRLFLAARQYQQAQEEANYVLQKDSNNIVAYQLYGDSLVALGEKDKALQAFAKISELSPDNPSSYINLALLELTLRRFDEAEAHFQRATQVDAHSSEAYSDLASFYRIKGDLVRADGILLKGIEQNPTSTDLFIARADLLYSLQKNDEAAEVLNRLRQQQGNSPDVALAIGDFYFQRGQTRVALLEYKRGLDVVPKNVEIKRQMEDLYLVTGEIQKAAELDQSLLRTKTKDPIILINHSRLLMAQGKADEAISELQKETKDVSDLPQIHYYLALAYMQKGSAQQAMSQMEEALRIAPDQIDILKSLAEMHLQQGDLALAQQNAERSVQLRPADKSIRLLLGKVYVGAAKYNLAREQFLIAQKLDADDLSIHVLVAQTYSAEHAWFYAEKELNTFLGSNPQDAVALGQLVDLLVASKQQPKAVERMTRYAKSYPDDAHGHLILGSLYLSMKNHLSALTELERSIALDPKQAQPHLLLGQVFQEQGRSDEAIQELQMALTVQPKLVPVLAMVGNLHLLKGELGQARSYYEQALTIDPNFAIAASNLAWVYAEQGTNLDVALDLAQRAKQLMPQLPAVADTLGWVYYKQGIYISALPLFQQCVEKEPESAVYHYHLGMTLLSLGNKTKAKTQLSAALRMELPSPEAKTADQALASLN